MWGWSRSTGFAALLEVVAFAFALSACSAPDRRAAPDTGAKPMSPSACATGTQDCSPMMGFSQVGSGSGSGRDAGPATAGGGADAGCGASCDGETLCGNGVLDPSEQCDPSAGASPGCIDCVQTPGWSCSADRCELTGCAAPLGQYSVSYMTSASVGSCQLSLSFASMVAIEPFWNGPANEQCDGQKTRSTDGCSIDWSGSCPLSGAPGHSEDTAHFVQVSSSRIEGTNTVRHVRNDGTSCSVTATLVLTRIEGPDGQACWEDAACTSDMCCTSRGSAPGSCTQRSAAACPAACDAVECGSANGIDCGGCSGLAYCTPQQTCEPACVDMECGQDHGVACGTCQGLRYCSAQQTCEPACVDMECGQDHGVACGTCQGLRYCGQRQTCLPACEGLTCGMDHGVSCGSCARGEVCSAGACVEALCPQSAYHCHDNAVYRCEASGLERSLFMQCEPDDFCDPSRDPPICRADLCLPGEAYCDGNLFTTCNSEGSGGAPGGEDCAAAGLDCSRYGCGDVVGWAPLGPEPVAAGGGFATGDYFAVDSEVVVSSIGVMLYLSAPTSMTVFVYEATTQTGTYTRIYERQLTVAGVGFRGDDAVGVVLQAGRFYLIGASVVAAGTAYRQVNGHPSSAAFGSSVAGFFANAAPGASVEYTATAIPDLYELKLITVRLP